MYVQHPLPGQLGLEGFALEILHDQERAVFKCTDLEHGGYRGVVYAGRGLCFLDHPLHCGVVSGKVGGEKLYRQPTGELGVLGQPDLSHPAFTERFQ